ncbi:ribonuclease HI family protein [Salinigranum halophilum]|uniref:ribonuclease HI family protein n=1 Tax=Salinigranum halophilum TaxID=2565931 RepID=UPI00115CFB56|nr:ribonuclease HI family protein [Salinigranum halophilum]
MTARTAPVPDEPLSPLAALTDRVLAVYGYEVSPAIDAIDDAVPGFGGLFDPGTTSGELTEALEGVLDGADDPERLRGRANRREVEAVLYADGSSRGNPGPAGAGAVLLDGDEETLARLGRPVGSNTGNNTAEYAALALGVDQLLTRYEPTRLEVRIDSMTVVRDVWQGHGSGDAGFRPYREAIVERLDRVPHHEWTHLADSDPNPADALATVGADIASLGPGV